jgi:hypothetical protein
MIRLRLRSDRISATAPPIQAVIMFCVVAILSMETALFVE